MSVNQRKLPRSPKTTEQSRAQAVARVCEDGGAGGEVCHGSIRLAPDDGLLVIQSADATSGFQLTQSARDQLGVLAVGLEARLSTHATCDAISAEARISRAEVAYQAQDGGLKVGHASRPLFHWDFGGAFCTDRFGRCKIGPDAPIVARAKVLTGYLAFGGALDGEAVLNGNLPRPILPLPYSSLGDAESISKRALRAKDFGSAFDGVLHG